MKKIPIQKNVMKKFFVVTLVLFLIEVLPVDAEQIEFKNAAREVEHTVVSVSVRLFDGKSIIGSGFVFNKTGYIITSTRLIKTTKGIEYQAKVMGRDDLTDTAVIKIKTIDELSEIKFGDSDALKVGDEVIACGHIFGAKSLDNSKGKIIAKLDDLILTDVKDFHEKIGGPIISIKGEVVGVNLGRVQKTETIHVMPINAVRVIAIELIKPGRIAGRFITHHDIKLPPLRSEIASTPSFGSSIIKSDVDKLPVMQAKPKKNAYAIVIGVEKYRQKENI